MQIQSILRNVTKERPKILTIYQNHSFLDMLSDFDVYCLVVPQIGEPKHPINMKNVVSITHYTQVSFDLCLSFSGGLTKRILEDIAKDRKIDCFTYELDYPIDIGSDLKFRSSSKNAIFPTNSFKEIVHGKGPVIPPHINKFFCRTKIEQRKLSACTIGDNLIETELSSHFSDWHEIVNTLPGCQIFGSNPRMGTFSPNPEQTEQILNDTKIYLNLKTYGYYPIEILQAMGCGCAVISYDFPGIKELLPKEFIASNKKEFRTILSELVAKPHLLPSISEFNIGIAKNYRKNYLSSYINKKWEDIHERGFQFYRVR